MRIGQAFVPGRGRERARQVLAAARKARVDVQQVRTTDGGYLVPQKVADVLDGKKTSARKRPTNKETDNG